MYVPVNPWKMTLVCFPILRFPIVSSYPPLLAVVPNPLTQALVLVPRGQRPTAEARIMSRLDLQKPRRKMVTTLRARKKAAKNHAFGEAKTRSVYDVVRSRQDHFDLGRESENAPAHVRYNEARE